MDKKKLAVCAIFKNEAPYLLEWLAYHHVVGVQHFVLYDNDSSDDGATLIRGSSFAEQVTRIHWPQRPGKLTAYRHFVDIFAPGFEWAAFIDLDEFLLPLSNRSVHDTLQRLDNAAAVLVHQRVFGPGPWNDRPGGLAIENYDLRAPDDFAPHRRVKSIVRCADLLDVTQDPNEFKVKGLVFNTFGHLVPPSSTQDDIVLHDLVVNHYHTRSRQDWREKLARGSAVAAEAGADYTPERVAELAAICQVKDETIKRFAPEIRSLLGIDAVIPVPPFAATATQPESAVTLPPPVTQPPPTPPPAMPQPAMAPRSSPAMPPPVMAPASPAPGWMACGPDAQQQADRRAMIFRDRSRPGAPWLAALRGNTASLIDPAFLTDEAGRLCDFPDDATARMACETALAVAP